MSRPFAIVVVALVALTWAIYLLAQGVALAWNLLGPFSVAVGVLTTAGLIFRHWAWHWPGLHLLTKTPRLAGTWVGTLTSSYEGVSDSVPRKPIDVAFVVTQLAGELNARLYTHESASTTVAASTTEELGDRHCLATVYLNEPAIERQGTSPIHFGATRLMIEGPARSPARMVGTYWTGRNTSGSLSLSFVCRARAHSFGESMEWSAKPPTIFAGLFR